MLIESSVSVPALQSGSATNRTANHIICPSFKFKVLQEAQMLQTQTTGRDL